ncbi:hybrid sensor histidine kinase/response regulator [Methylobacter sp. YRD-M1]|uniref:hybrid sensor histidine kinase/response regulator n=1 Tax=Methylobacter sp. YRD-M1 TaxID=2911520 RepID=UPI00227BFA81|nr:ATP-binding protein [Methylobacter sp. YRD-M1]WAK00827.1 ATP-binding protein [Methylobacter sp. YRD-M1]
MNTGNKKNRELLLKIHDLTLRLEEAQDALSAIRAANVDAVVVYNDGQHHIYTLEGVDTIYKRLFDTLNEGVLVVSADRTILYANRWFADLIGVAMARITGANIGHFVHPAYAADFAALLENAAERPHRDDLSMIRADGSLLPVMLAVSPAPIEGLEAGCAIVVNDLTELSQAQDALRKANEELEARIEARTMDLRSANIALEAEIAERMRIEEALRNEDRRKDEFLAMLAHELRNPLAPIRNAAQILKHPGLDETRLAWCRNVIDRQVEQLARLVDDLLDVSRISRGKIELKKEPIAVSAIVQRAMETIQPLIEARRHELTVQLPSEPIIVEGDLVRLSQVVANLLSNSAKYTDEGGAIWLTVEQAGNDVFIRVRDNGRGIDPSSLPNLFQLFYQVDRTLDRSEGGLGIGLSLVKSLVAMHGGQVWATSTGRGQGSVFIIRLPCLPQASVVPISSPTALRPAESPLRILIVDDNRDAAQSLSVLLTSEGHTVSLAYSGPAGLVAALTERPQVILLDIGLPGMDGYAVARALREHPELKTTQLIALSGYGRQVDREQARAAGFNGYLTKPVDFDELQYALSQSLLVLSQSLSG